MRIINLIDNLSLVNFGIWNAALATAPILLDQHDCKSYAWYPALEKAPQVTKVEQRSFTAFGRPQLLAALEQGAFSPADTLIVSHGCWQFPTRWGHALHKMGYKWITVPHGIPSLKQPLSEKPASPRRFLFMARLHHKKGLLPMVHAWLNSTLANNSQYQLAIAGPDDGELPALNQLLATWGVTNIQYVGAVYGAEKEDLLQRSHFYLLLSFSGGFPTSLLEAMQYGLIPLMPPGCNFPEALDAKIQAKLMPPSNCILKLAIHLKQ